MAYTVEQQYSIARAARRVETATEALTLTQNPSAVLLANFNTAVADFYALANQSPDPLKATVTNGQAIPLHTVTGGNLGQAVPIAVAAGAVVDVRLSGNVSLLASGFKSTAPVTGSGTTGVTPTIVNGSVTGWVLS